MAKVIKNRISGVGVELEGGWEGPPKGMRAEHIIRDGSVVIDALQIHAQRGGLLAGTGQWVDPSTLPPRPMPRLLVGEIPSPVLTLDSFGEWMRRHYPQHVNETCGLHTHCSFQFKLNYMRLMTPEFTPFVVKGLIEWAEAEKLPKSHPIWNRLLKKNHNHCAHIYLGDNQVRQARKDYNSRGTPHSRYTALNYCYGLQKSDGEDGVNTLKTVECRLLPMMETADQAVRAVGTVFDLTNRFLAKIRTREVRHEARVALAPPIESRYRSRI